MKLLLDTHVLLWSLLEPERLTAEARRRLEDDRNELWISPISAWETLLLIERGRVELGPETQSAAAWVRRALAAAPLREAPLTVEVALASRIVRLDHRDPADRFLVATASVYDLVLATADARLLACPDIRTLRCA